MVKGFFLIVSIFIFSCVNGQKIDSLMSLLLNSKGIEKIEIYNELAFLTNKIEPAKSIDWSYKSIALSKKQHHDKGLFDAYTNLGIVYTALGKYDSSVVFLNHALVKAKKLNDEVLKASTFHNLSSNYIAMGDYTLALNYLTQAATIFEKEHNQQKFAKTCINLGDLYQKIGDKKSAEKFLLKAIKIAEDSKDKSLFAAAQNTYGIYLAGEGSFDSALVYFSNSAIIREEIKQFSELYWNYNNMGGIYYYLNQLDKALYYFNKSLEIAKIMNSDAVIATVYNNIGSVLNQMKQFDKAIEHHLLALDLSDKINNSTVKKDALENLYLANQNKGDYKKALEYHKQFTNYSDSIFSIEKTEQLANIQTKYETEYKVKEIEQEREVAKANAVAEGQKKRMLLLVLIAVILIAVFVLVLIALNNKKKKAELEITAQKKIVEAIFEAEEKERTRIAKDLHDGIVQNLTALKLAVINAAKNSPTQVVELENIGGDLEKTTKEVREISYQMMPVTLKELGLIKALEELLQRNLTNVDIQFEFNHFGLEHRLPEKIEVNVYRICQELINNSIKHSQATNISILLQIRNNILQLTYEDNGVGFDSNKVRKGIGLNSLNSRVEMVKGSLEFNDTEVSGTTAYIRIPL